MFEEQIRSKKHFKRQAVIYFMLLPRQRTEIYKKKKKKNRTIRNKIRFLTMSG